MNPHADKLAEAVVGAHAQFESELHGKGRFPRRAFDVWRYAARAAGAESQ